MEILSTMPKLVSVKRSHEVFGMDGEDGFITSLYRRESRRPQQGSLGHIIQ